MGRKNSGVEENPVRKSELLVMNVSTQYSLTPEKYAPVHQQCTPPPVYESFQGECSAPGMDSGRPFVGRSLPSVTTWLSRIILRCQLKSCSQPVFDSRGSVGCAVTL